MFAEKGDDLFTLGGLNVATAKLQHETVSEGSDFPDVVGLLHNGQCLRQVGVALSEGFLRVGQSARKLVEVAQLHIWLQHELLMSGHLLSQSHLRLQLRSLRLVEVRAFLLQRLLESEGE